MKNRAVTMLASLLLGLLTLGSAAQAQRNTRVIKTNIPFDFTLGDQSFPAGRYQLQTIEPAQLELRDSSGHVLIHILTQSVQTMHRSESPKLVFDSASGGHVLTQVWQANESIGQQLPLPKYATRAVRKRSGHVQTAEAGNPR